MKMFFPQCLQVLILLTVLRPRCINASGKLILFSNCLILVIVLLSVRTQHSLVTFQIKLSLFVTVKRGFIRCENGSKIRIMSANYGRTDDQVCPGVAISTRTCLSKSSEIKVKWNCNGYASCHLRASSQIFGDPCANFSKFLEVKYHCVSNFHLKGIIFLPFKLLQIYLKNKIHHFTLYTYASSIFTIEYSYQITYVRYDLSKTLKIYCVCTIATSILVIYWPCWLSERTNIWSSFTSF